MAYRYTEEELLEELHRLKSELSKTPYAQDMTDHGEYGENTYIRRFGSWNEALEEAGLEVNKNGIVSDEELKEELLRLADGEYGGDYLPASVMKEKGKYSSNLYASRFGSWNQALKEADLEVRFHQDFNEKDLIEELHRLSEKAGRTPTYEMMEEFGKYGKSTYERTFGSWSNALEEVGYELNKLRVGNRREVNYGPSWKMSNKSEVLLRDQYRCQACFTGKNELGQKPDLHHIEPARYWNVEKEHEEMNDSGNLITLCRSCHRTYQGLWRSLEPKKFAEKARKDFNS